MGYMKRYCRGKVKALVLWIEVINNALDTDIVIGIY